MSSGHLYSAEYEIPGRQERERAPKQTSVTERWLSGTKVYIEPGVDDAGKTVVACLLEKLQEHGAFQVVAANEAVIVLAIRAKIPSGAKRVLLGSTFGGGAEVHMRARDTSGKLVWEGKNKYKKSSTAWGAGTDIGCGLANGIVKKLAAELW